VLLASHGDPAVVTANLTGPLVVAPDGETGLKLMRTFQPDAIVLDLMLPKMSGVEVIKQIRSEADFSKLPIIVFDLTVEGNIKKVISGEAIGTIVQGE